jgi:hypothetical protein
MSTRLLISGVLAIAGVVCLAIAVSCERAMHRHRQPGVTYMDATLRRDGGWRRTDLFTEAGLRHQRRASMFGALGTVLLVAALLVYVLLGITMPPG